jgi:hypothetical protein
VNNRQCPSETTSTVAHDAEGESAYGPVWVRAERDGMAPTRGVGRLTHICRQPPWGGGMLFVIAAIVTAISFAGLICTNSLPASAAGTWPGGM